MFDTCVDPMLLETLGALVVILYLAVIVRVLFGRTKHTDGEPTYGASAMRPPVPKPFDRRPSPPRRRCPSKGMGEPIPCCECHRLGCDIRKS